MTDKKELGIVIDKKVRRVSGVTVYGIYFEKKLIWLDDTHELERVSV